MLKDEWVGGWGEEGGDAYEAIARLGIEHTTAAAH